VSAMNSHGILVRIAPDGMCFIDDEYFAPPPGAPLNQAVLEHLQLESAALETPLTVAISDEQSKYTVNIQVNPDGTSQPIQDTVAVDRTLTPTTVAQTGIDTAPGAPAPSTSPAALLTLKRPHEALAEPFQSRLQTACNAVESGDIAGAASGVDQIIAELSDAFGSHHLAVVAAGIVRGDIALMAHDHEYGLRIWAFIAETWQGIVGQADLTTIPMVGNALWCWSQLPQAHALAARETITTLLQRVPVPGGDSALQNVYRRLQLLS
jgi:hypothetical protein